jgi:histidyl-tRNA synthetase
MKTLYKRLRGMPDILPVTVGHWQHLEQTVRTTMRSYAYGEMRTPIIESTALFERSIGEATDIVEKEMYTFSSRKGSKMTLRPENTAGCVRAAIENGLLQPGSVNRIWYTGSMFRYERPQLGRQRQFWQTGAEVYGLAGAEIEAELILLSARLWKQLNIYDALTLEINTLGTPECRAAHRELLVAYFTEHQSQLDEDSQRRLLRNPLRILDSKNPDMQQLIEDAPKLQASLSEEAKAHFDLLQQHLSASGIQFKINPRLVRGLDYYSHTVFEWTTDKLGAQSAVCAGGRYDGLLEQMGAAGVPGVGWAFGMERVIALMDELSVLPAASTADIFVMSSPDVPTGYAMAMSEEVRDELPQLTVMHNTGGGSMKSQFRKADKSGASLALVVAGDEVNNNTVTVKALRNDTGQQTVDRSEMISTISSLL